MNIPYSINQLDETQLKLVIKELYPLDNKIENRVDMVIAKAGISKADALEYVVTSNPVLWAKVYLDWESRPYQHVILSSVKRSRNVVLRLGRRLGKTDSMCVLALWHAYTQINKGKNDQYDVLIIGPYETQVDLIFDRLKQLIDSSPLMQGMLQRDIHHRIEFINGTKIQGITAGAASGSGAANTRGLRADLIIFDETDYIGSANLTNIINIRNEAPQRIKIIAASTPCGKHEEFYRWCVNASTRYAPKQEDIDNFTFSDYVSTENKNGNGWVEVYAPSTVNKELLKTNPDTKQTFLQDIKDELSEMRYAQEVMAEFGEEEMGVYQKKYIESAIAEGERLNYKYITDYPKEFREEYLSKPKTGPRILGIDWDKTQAGTNMVCMQLDNLHMDEEGRMIPIFKVLFRIEIPRTEFTYTNAVNKIIELNDEYDFDWIAVDKGYGETQIELLHRYGMENPETGLADKVVGFQFSEKIEVRDPHTLKKDRKPMKPFMVNNSVNIFEKNKIILNPNDKLMRQQIENYTVKSISVNGLPIYTDINEHIVDAMNLALLMYELKYSTLLRKVIATKVIFFDGFNNPDNIKERNTIKGKKDENKLFSIIKFGNQQGYITNRKKTNPAFNSQRRAASFRRASF